MPRRSSSLRLALVVQGLAAAGLGVAWIFGGSTLTPELKAVVTERGGFRTVPVPRREPLVIAPLYDRPDFISDVEVLAVLEKVQPRFPLAEMKPNHVEHALRTWSIHATFDDPGVRSGRELERFLTDSGSFLESWGPKIRPLLEERPTGVAIRWGQEKCGSVHHDHCLASLTEAGAALDTPVFGPSRHDATLNNVLQEALCDFRLDERETEWTALAFGLWLPPEKEWIGGDGRHYSFDLLARQLLRGQKEFGVCSGTHRVYSLAVLMRLDDDFPGLLTPEVRDEVVGYLEQTRDAIIASQFPDGHWPSNWPDGAEAVAHPVEDDLSKKVIATGHHLEWLAIAPRHLHPPEEQIRKAFRWAIDTTASQTPEQILERYTFFSHVGCAAALWRKSSPNEFWQTHRSSRVATAQ